MPRSIPLTVRQILFNEIPIIEFLVSLSSLFFDYLYTLNSTVSIAILKRTFLSVVFMGVSIFTAAAINSFPAVPKK